MECGGIATQILKCQHQWRSLIIFPSLQFHSQKNSSPTPSEQESGWAKKTVLTLCYREKSCHSLTLNPDCLVIQSVANNYNILTQLFKLLSTHQYFIAITCKKKLR